MHTNSTNPQEVCFLHCCLKPYLPCVLKCMQALTHAPLCLQTEMVDQYKLDGVGVEADVVASNAGAPTSKNVSWLVS